MARPGPPPQPTPLRVLRGNPGKKRVNTEEPSPLAGPCEPPADLSEGARAIWADLATELEASGLLAPRYVRAFAQYCEAYVNWRKAADLVVMGGPVVIGREGQLVSNPASREFARYMHLTRFYGDAFGLNPAAVTAIGRDRAQGEEGQRNPRRLLG